MDRYRLPRTVVPSRYDLRLEPDLAAATFAGRVEIAVTVREPVEEIVLNAAELQIAEAVAEGERGNRLTAAVTLEEETERCRLRFESAADEGPMALGLTFSGTLNDKLRGFYRSKYKNGSGERRWLAATQFEATDARRAFPCWDEPAFKAVFASTLVVDPALQSSPTPPSPRSASRTARRSSASPTPSRCPRTWSLSSSASWRRRSRRWSARRRCASGACRASSG